MSPYAHLSDAELLLQADIPEILACLNNGGPYTKTGLRHEIDTDTRPDAFFEEIDALEERGFVTVSGDDVRATNKKPR